MSQVAKITKKELSEWRSLQPLYDPYEVMRQVINRGESAALAERLGCSATWVRNWQRPPETPEEYQNTGRKGPIQRLGEVIDFIIVQDGQPDRAYPIGRHIARRLGGVFFPARHPSRSDSAATAHITDILKNAAESVEAVREAWFEDNPGLFTPAQRREVMANLEDAMASILSTMRWVNDESDK